MRIKALLEEPELSEEEEERAPELARKDIMRQELMSTRLWRKRSQTSSAWNAACDPGIPNYQIHPRDGGSPGPAATIKSCDRNLRMLNINNSILDCKLAHNKPKFS